MKAARFIIEKIKRILAWPGFKETIGTAHNSDWAMALELYKSGKEFQHLIRKSHMDELIGHLKIQGIAKPDSKIFIRVRTAKDSHKAACDACSKFRNKEMTIAEALNNMPLPIDGCTHKIRKKDRPGWCRCSFQLRSIGTKNYEHPI